MRKLLTSRLFRCTLCLILVCCMIVNCIAIKAEASVLGGTALALFGDDAIALIAACLVGLGVMANLETEMDTLTFRNLCQDAYDAMAAAGEWVVDGAVTVYNCATDLWDYGVDCGMVQWLHEWLFSNNILCSGDYTVLGGQSFTNVLGAVITCVYPFNVVRFTWKNRTYEAYFNNYAEYIYINGSAMSTGTIHNGERISWCYSEIPVSSGALTVSGGSIGAAFFNAYDLFMSGSYSGHIYTDSDLLLGTVAPPGTEIETEYGEYIVIVAPNGVPDTGGDGSGDDQPKIPIIPVPVLPSYEETIQLPQEDIWKGNKVETEDPDTGGSTDPTTGTDTDDPDSGSNDPTTPTTGTDTDPDTQPDSPGTPSSDIGDYQIDLKKFFPFCIPFDLYDFFMCLNADPVAPVIEWVIPLPGGDTYPLEIDLSAFDDVAQLLRRLQLLLFCVGLAFKTRDLIKG